MRPGEAFPMQRQSDLLRTGRAGLVVQSVPCSMLRGLKFHHARQISDQQSLCFLGAFCSFFKFDNLGTLGNILESKNLRDPKKRLICHLEQGVSPNW